MKILVVKLADLGDLLLSEPAIRSLRLAFPDARIDVLTTPHATRLLPSFDLDVGGLAFEKALFDTPGVGALLSAQKAGSLAFSLRATGYDRVVLLHHLTTTWGAAKYRALARATGAGFVAGLDNGRGDFLTHSAVDHGFGHKHEAEYMLDVARVAGGADTPAVPRIHPEPEALTFELPESFVAIAPAAGAFSNARVWPADRFARLAKVLADSGHTVVVVGGDDATGAGRNIVDRVGASQAMNLTGATTLNQLALILQRSSLLIGNDSFPAHLAAAVGAPVLAIFGPSNREAWAPRIEQSIALSAKLPCSPCLYTGYRLGRRDGCPSRTCLDMITPEMAFEKSLELLGA